MGAMEQVRSEMEPAGGNIDAVWLAYADGRDAERRAQLVNHYLPFARMMAAKLYAGRTHREVEFDEYLQFARLGLMEAIDRFDPRRGFRFETFAGSRINGAILNGMASYSEVHEQVAARKRVVQARLESLKDDAPDSNDAEALFGYLAQVAIGLAVGFALDQSGMYREDGLEQHYSDNTYADVELKQLRNRIHSLVEQLAGKQRQVIIYHYRQHLPFEEIAGMLLLSKGRISQLHKEALSKLREGLLAQEHLDWSG